MFDFPEGATPIDEDEKQGLRISHISTREEQQREVSTIFFVNLGYVKKPKTY